MSEETDGQIDLTPDALPRDPVDADEVAAAVAAVANDAAATAADEKTAEEAAIEAAVGEEASVLISEAAAGKFIILCCCICTVTWQCLTPNSKYVHTHTLIIMFAHCQYSRSRCCSSSVCRR